MKKILNHDIEFLKTNSAYYTASEIAQQPDMWLKTLDLINAQKQNLISFLKPIICKSNINIILTGAGTSAFIGDTVQGIVQKKLQIPTRSIATTDLVTHPDLFIPLDKPVLLISFARSGDSPESVKTVDLAENLSNKIYHLIITCNANGFLTKQTLRKSYVILLPEETNDRSLAMTSSFSSMLATILMIADLVSGISFSDKISIAADYIRNTLEKSTILLQEIAKLDFNRAIFLGSGPMLGIAREGHLKLQELTDGKVICKFDSFLGFRHGPRAVINDKSILIYLFSGDHYVSQYEKDLVTSIEKSRKGLLRIGIMENNIRTINISKKIVFSDKHRLEDAYLALCHVVPVQILGFLKSIESGLKPDNPSENGVISRVVEGVTVYPYNQVKNETASITKTGATT